MWEVWHDEWAGTFEFMCGRQKARELLSGGMTRINGEPVTLSIVDEWPGINATQIRATIPTGRAR